MPDFTDPKLFDLLEAASPAELDRLAFGLIRMDRSGRVVHYNEAEAGFSGLDPERHVLGLNFFVGVAPCTNNYLIAQRYEDEDDLDDTLDYVFTYRLKPVAVRLRLLKRRDAPHQYLCVVPAANG